MNYSKKIHLLLPLLLCFFASESLLAQKYSKKRGIKGDGNVIQESREVGRFSAIDIGGVFTVYLRQGQENSLKVEADANLMPFIEIDKKGETLEVSLQKDTNINKWTEMNLYLTMVEVEEISLSGMVSLKGETRIQGDEIMLRHSGMGASNLDLLCNKLEASISGMAKLHLTGESNQVFLENAGMGNIEAQELKATRLKIDNSGMGHAEVYATTLIDISSTGMGKVTYSGGAEVATLSSSGMSRVKKK